MKFTNWQKMTLLVLAMFLTLFAIIHVGYAQLGGGESTVGVLDQWKSDGTNITQRTASKPIKITGFNTSKIVCTDSNGILTTTGCPSSGGGSGGGTFSTSTSPVANELLNYPNNSTDIVLIGSTSGTSTAKFYFDPNIKSAFFTAASSTAFEVTGNAYIPKLTNLTSNGFVKTGSGNGTLSVDTTVYLSAVTADSPLSGSGTSGSHLTLSTAGTWSGNAGTATALAANGTNCSSGSFPLGVDASGNSENCTVATTGTVTSVGLSDSNSTLTIGSTPVTTSGTITATLNLAHGNTWSALQQFANASSTTISAGWAKFGETASTTIARDGTVTVQGLTISGLSTGCLTNTSGVVSSTGVACGSGGGGGGSGSDPFTHTTYGGQSVSATSTGLLFTGSPFSLLASTTFMTNASTTRLNIGNSFVTNIIGNGAGLDIAGNLLIDHDANVSVQGLNKSLQESLGQNWTALGSPNSQTTADTVFSMGGGYGMVTGTSILTTQDYGVSWTSQVVPAGESEALSGAYLGRGIVVLGTYSNGHIARSTDYGSTWTDIGQLGTTTTIYAIANVGNGIAIATARPNNAVYRTTNYGVTWTLAQYLQCNLGPGSIEYVGKGVALMGCDMAPNTNKLYRSTDYGVTWTASSPFGAEQDIDSIKSLSNGVVLAGTYPNADIFRSTDFGQTFSLSTSSFALASATSAFADMGNGEVLSSTALWGKYVLKSVDYGQTWTNLGKDGGGNVAYQGTLQFDTNRVGYLGNGAAIVTDQIGNFSGPITLFRSADTLDPANILGRNLYITGSVGIASTSPGTLLSLGTTNGINFSTATSSFNSTGGINLQTGGCYAIKGVCIGAGSGGGSGTVTSVTASTPNSTLSLGGTNPVTTSGTISFDLNLNNANNWAGLQQFKNASSTLFSAGSSWFGSTATTTINGAGAIAMGTSTPWASMFAMNALGGTAPLFDIGSSTADLFNISASTVGFGSYTIGSTSPFALFTGVRPSGTTPLLALATSSTAGSQAAVFELDAYGRPIYGGPRPTCDANCTMSAGNDARFRIITGSTITSTTVTFVHSWGTAPVCFADEGSAGTVVADASSTPTTVVITLASALTSKDIEVHCDGINNQ